MIKTLALTILLGMSSIMVNRAENLVDHYANMPSATRQIPNSEQSVRDYFSSIDADTIYAIAYPPANCPRCEAQIIPVEALIKRLSPSATTALISIYPDKNAAQAYNIKRRFNADHHIYDTDDRYRDFLSFSAGTLHIPYLLKVAKSTGKVIAAVECEESSEEFINDMINYTRPLPTKRYLIDEDKEYLFKPTSENMNLKKRYSLSIPDSISISEIHMQPEFSDAGLFFNDKLRYSILMFSPDCDNRDKLSFRAEIKTDSVENKRFVTVSDSIYRILGSDNGIAYMPLSPKIIDSATLAISYSLPKLFKTDHGTIGYMNQAAILTVDTKTLRHKSLIPLLHSHQYFHPHFSFYTTPTEIITGCTQLTWPMGFDRDEYETTPENNPFDDTFYKKPNPIMAAFGRDSWKLEKLFGQLPEHAAKSKTGQYFCGYIFDYCDGEVIWSDAVSGQISIADSTDYNNVKEKLSAFSIPDDCIPAPDSSLFYSYECAAAYEPVFCRTITHMKLTKDKIHCIVRYGNFLEPELAEDRHTYVEIDRHTGKAVERQIPVPAGHIPMAYGLRVSDNGAIDPYSITRTIGNRDISVNIYSL